MYHCLKQVMQLLAVAILLSACNENASNIKNDTAVIGEKAPAIAALDEHGELAKFPLNSAKPTLINFWQTGCGVCIIELKALSEYLNQYPNAFNIIAINIADDDISKLTPLMREKGVLVPLYSDQFAISSERYQVSATPDTYLISPDGTVVARHRGLLNLELLSQWLH